MNRVESYTVHRYGTNAIIKLIQADLKANGHEVSESAIAEGIIGFAGSPHDNNTKRMHELKFIEVTT